MKIQINDQRDALILRLGGVLLLALGIAAPAYAADGPNSAQKADVRAAIEYVKKPGEPIDNMGTGELQVYYRLHGLRRETGYVYGNLDVGQWDALMKDTNASMYARLCAAYFVADDDAGARGLVQEQLRSKNLRYRFNAARMLELFVYKSDGAAREWAVGLLITLLDSRALEEGWKTRFENNAKGEFPENDRDDVMAAPIDSVCLRLGWLKETRAVPGLVSLVKRRIRAEDAAAALGDIGAAEAGPVILELLRSNEFVANEHLVVNALAKLKYLPAAPVLAKRLLGPPRANPKYTTARILDALLEIGDPVVVPDIEKYLQGTIPPELRSAARRVLIEFKENDPVPGLLDLLDQETDKYQRMEIVSALVRHKDGRVVRKLGGLARSSDSASTRSDAIWGLQRAGGQGALLELASLLEVKFPKDLKADLALKGQQPSDFSEYFAERVALGLRLETKQDFGADSQKWRQWIQANVPE